jgi:hypothetical protein
VSRQTTPALLVAAAAIVAAALGLRAAMLASEASSGWESSVRVEVREGATTVRAPLVVFDEAQFAARVATTRFRAEEILRELDGADPVVAPTLLAESTVLMALAEANGGGVGNAALDVDRQLEEELEDARIAGEPSPNEHEEDADSAGERAALTAAAAVPAGLAFLLGAAAQAFPRRRRALVALGVVALVVAVAAGIAVA